MIFTARNMGQEKSESFYVLDLPELQEFVKKAIEI